MVASMGVCIVSSNEFMDFITRNDINHGLALVTGALIAFHFIRDRGKDINLPTIPLWYSLVFVALMSLNRLFNDPLWYDETFAVVTSRLDHFSDVFTVILSDVHTPTHYFLLHLWIKVFGDSQIAVRVPSLIAGVLTVFVSYRLARTFYNRNWSSWSALLVAMTPSVIHYSAEARYPIFLLLSVLLALLAIREKWRFSYIWIAIPVWWHITAVPYSIMLLWYARKSLNRGQLAVGLILSLIMTPLALLQINDVTNGFWLKLRFPLHHLIMNFATRQNEWVLLVIVLLGMVVTFSSKHQKYRLLIWGVPSGVWIISYFVVPVYLFRTLMASVVLIVIFSTPLLFQRKTLAFVTLLMTLSLFMYFGGMKELSVKEVLEQCEGQDYVAATSTGMTMMILYHSDLPAYTYGINTNSQWLSQDAKRALGFTRPPEGGRGCTLLQNNYEMELLEYLQIANKELFASFDYGQFTQLEVYHG